MSRGQTSPEAGGSATVVVEQGKGDMSVLLFGGGWPTVVVPPVQTRKRRGRGGEGWCEKRGDWCEKEHGRV